MEYEYPDYDYMEIVWQIRQTVIPGSEDRFPGLDLRVFRLDRQKYRRKLLKPHKETLLHRLIKVECELASQNFQPSKYGLRDLESYLKPFLDDKEMSDEEIGDQIAKWSKYWEKHPKKAKLFSEDLLLTSRLPLTDFVNKIIFPILFSDHFFLYHFNLLLRNLVSFLEEEYASELLDENGYIKRKNPPEWLRKGIKKRDQATCVQCGETLDWSQVEETGHLDHIIPLSKQGTNDPTNYQLLCESCNKEKATDEIRPPRPQVTYW